MSPVEVSAKTVGQGSQRLRMRLLWFAVGGVIGYVLNAGPFFLIERYLGWSPRVGYAISLGVQTFVFFLWNYFVNFRTSAAWQDCAWRYLAAVGLFYVGNYLLAQLGFWLAPEWRYLVIAAVPVALAALKFSVYHWWVFPRQRR